MGMGVDPTLVDAAANIWTTICIFWTAIYGFVLWDRN
jgi:hypothetical protein